MHSRIAAVYQLKREIGRLIKEQNKARQAAIYVGMTSGQAQEYDRRQEQIRQLTLQWAALEKVRLDWWP